MPNILAYFSFNAGHSLGDPPATNKMSILFNASFNCSICPTGFSALYTYEPATKTSAPASRQILAVSGTIPPSTSMV